MNGKVSALGTLAEGLLGAGVGGLVGHELAERDLMPDAIKLTPQQAAATGAAVGGVGALARKVAECWATDYFKQAAMAPKAIAKPVATADAERVKKLMDKKPMLPMGSAYPRPTKSAEAIESWATEYFKIAALGLVRPLPANHYAVPGSVINPAAGNALKMRTRPNIKPQMSNESSSHLAAPAIVPGVPAKIAEAFAFLFN